MHPQAQRTWIWIVAVLAGVWSGIAVFMWVTSDQVSNPEKVLALMAEAPWRDNPNLKDSLRQAYLDRVIASQNLLDFSQRRDLRDEGDEAVTAFFDTLTEPEQHRYADGTVKPFLNKVVKILDSMSVETRRNITARLRKETGAGGGRGGRDRERERREGPVPATPAAEPAPANTGTGTGTGATATAPAAAASTPPPEPAKTPAPKEGEFDDFIGLGLEMQYQEAPARRKLEMGQMLENMQAFLQGFRR